MGKTHLIEKFLRDHRSRFDEFTGVTRLPVACVQMPPSPNERDFYEELLVGLCTVLPNGLSVTALRHRTRVLARQVEVRMLVIDEIHSMLAGTFREQRIFLNSLRFLANDLRIPLVCLSQTTFQRTTRVPAIDRAGRARLVGTSTTHAGVGNGVARAR
jgi:Bacterial TniB protein